MNRTQIFRKTLETVVFSWNEQKQRQFLKVYTAFQPHKTLIRIWLSIYKECIKSNSQMKRASCIRFLNIAYDNEYIDITFDLTRRLIRNLKRYNEHNKLKISVTRVSNPSEQFILPPNILTVDPEQFAINTTRVVAKIYNAITPREFIQCALGPIYDLHSTGVGRLTQIFEDMAHFVQHEIQSQKKDQPVLIKHFIQIAHWFEKYENYHMLFAVLVGLSNSDIQQKELFNLIDPCQNYAHYRNRIKTCDNYIPFTGIINSDIKNCLQVGLYQNDNINWPTYEMLVTLINAIPTYAKTRKHVRWSPQDVAEWLKNKQLGQYAAVFIREDIHGDVLAYITEKHMKEQLGITKLGHRLRLTRAIRHLT